MDKVKKECDINIRIEKAVKEKFILVCKKNKTNLSKRIRDFINKEIKK